MEQRYNPTEHVTEHTKRPCVRKVPEAGETMGMQLKEKEMEEQFRLSHPDFDKQYPRYTGICGSHGNVVFTDTPVEPPTYLKPLITYGLEGYERPFQHPMYTTSHHDYGQQPSPAYTTCKYYPKIRALTKNLPIGANYEDTHFNTTLDGNCPLDYIE